MRRRKVEFEYENIDEDCCLTREDAQRYNVPHCDDVVEKNILEALKAHGVSIEQGDYISVYPGYTIDFSCDERQGTCWWDFNFEVRSPGRDEPKYIGRAVATFVRPPKRKKPVYKLVRIDGVIG
ncbi:MAG: hypothetical protein QW517_03460 [Thermofilaceae archaeon]